VTDSIRLTSYSRRAGCAAKVGPGDLQDILSRLPEESRPELLSSTRNGEDAGVYLLSEGLAMVQTVDFFGPMVDDPYSFGQIAAANALSDIYAMGGKPLTSLNVVAYPCELELDIIESMLRGGYDKVHEAGAVVVGGHTVHDEELKYGMAVTGVVDPARMTTIDGARPGDLLVLTKPIGTGILATALKADFISEKEIGEAIESMCALNAGAAGVLSRHEVSACTDVTGFGLAGHLFEMLRAGNVSAELWADEVPLLEHALEMASMGMVPEGQFRNRRYVIGAELPMNDDRDDLLVACIYDPQTSGGLLAAIGAGQADAAVEELHGGGAPRAAVIGKVTPRSEKLLRVRHERND